MTYEEHITRADIRRQRRGKRHIPFYVVAYRVTRHFGGPQEGGWWYDWTTILAIRVVDTWRSAMRAVRELRKAYPTCPYGRFSMRGGADVYIRPFYDQREFPIETKERPYYG